MKRIIIFLLVLIPIWTQAQGDLTDGKTIGGNQDARFRLTLLAGFNASQIDGDCSGGFNKIGVNVAGQVNILLDRTDWVGRFQPSVGIGFSQLGSRTVSNDLGASTNGGCLLIEPQLYELAYAQIPVMLHYIDQRWVFSTGLAYGRLVNFKYSEGGVDFTDAKVGAYRTNDVNFIGGTTYYITRNIGINLHWEHSLFSINSFGRQVHRLITFRLAYTF